MNAEPAWHSYLVFMVGVVCFDVGTWSIPDGSTEAEAKAIK